MSFVQRILTVQLVIGSVPAPVAPGSPSSSTNTQQAFTGANGQTGNVLTLSSNLRVGATISASGQAQLANAQITIFGMTESEMNTASTFAKWPRVITNSQVFLYGGDAGGAQSLIFSGTIIRAVADLNAQPDTAFHIEARSGVSAQMLVLPPTSAAGSQNAASLLQALAQSAGFIFENNSNVNVQLTNPYHRGSAMDQIRSIADAAGINQVVDGNTLAIWPKGQSRQTGGQTVTISYADGSMIGYPVFGGPTDMTVKCLYNPSIKYGATVAVMSHLPSATGSFFLFGFDHYLESNWPDGTWFSALHLTAPAEAISA